MKRKKYIPTFIGSVETFEGESIEEKIGLFLYADIVDKVPVKILNSGH